MRRSWLILLGLAILLPSNSGCRQTNGTTALTPIGAGTIGPLSPVGGGTAASSLTPLGQPTRVPPPATGSSSAPNNYLGGSASVGQAYQPPAAYDSFSSVAPNHAVQNNGQPGSGVAPTGWTQQDSDPRSFAPAANQYAPQQQASAPLSPTLGGMRIIDMTRAPSPPGYRPPNRPPSFQTQPYQGGQNFGPAPQQYGTQSQVPGSGNSLQTIQIPGRGEIALGQGTTRIQPNGPSATIARRSEFPMQTSPTEPSFQGSERFSASQPSTDPVDNRFESQQENLPWRPPGTQY